MQNSTTDDEDFSGSGSSENDVTEASTIFMNPTFYMNSTEVYSQGTYTTSTAILAVVSVVAILTLLVFAVLSLRYRYAHKGSYHVREFKEDVKMREVGEVTETNNIYESTTTKEWLL